MTGATYIFCDRIAVSSNMQTRSMSSARHRCYALWWLQHALERSLDDEHVSYYDTLATKAPDECEIRVSASTTNKDALLSLQPGEKVSSFLLMDFCHVLNRDRRGVFCMDPTFINYLKRRDFAHIDHRILSPRRVRKNTDDWCDDAFHNDHIVAFVNVNEIHWVLLHFDVAARRVLVHDSLLALGLDHEPLLQVARDWVEARTGRHDWSAAVDDAFPQQNNGHDCGVFAMTCALLLARERRPNEFEQGHMEDMRVALTYSIKEGAFVL